MLIRSNQSSHGGKFAWAIQIEVVCSLSTAESISRIDVNLVLMTAFLSPCKGSLLESGGNKSRVER